MKNNMEIENFSFRDSDYLRALVKKLGLIYVRK